MSKEREATLSELQMREFMDAGYRRGVDDTKAHYQPLLDAKDAEIAELKKNYEGQLEVSRIGWAQADKLGDLQKENATIKALLEQAREGLGFYADRENYLSDAEEYIEPLEGLLGAEVCMTIIDEAGKDAGARARSTLAAINAATGEK